MRFKWWIAALVGILVLAFLSSRWFLSRNGSDDTNRVGTVARQDLLQKVTVAGTITAVRTTIIMAPYDGYVKKLYVRLGDKVPKWGALVSVAQTLQGIEPVYPIRAPFSGTVVHLMKSEGQYARRDDSKEYILRLDDLSQLYVDVDAPEIDVAKIKVGQEAEIRATSILGKTFKGEVEDMFMASNQKEGWQKSQADFRVRVRILGGCPELKPGMSALLDIVTNRKANVLNLGHEFIHQEGDEYFVILLNNSRQKIKLGLQNESGSEISEGLQEGEKVKQVDFIKLSEKLGGQNNH